MPQTRKQFIVILLLMIALGILVSCKTKPELIVPPVPGMKIGITEDICPTVIIRVGDYVTWTNDGRVEHIVRHLPQEGPMMFDSGLFTPGGSFTMNFPQPGVYSYTCSEDGAMTGTITVNP